MHGKSGFASDVLYLAQRSTPNGGVALYGIVEGYELALDAKEYHLTLDVAQWDAYENKRALKVQVLPLAAVDTESGAVIDETAILAEDFKEVEPEFNNSKDATKFDVPFTVAEAGNYVIRMVPSKPDGSFNGYSDGCAIGNVKVQFIPDVLGIIESLSSWLTLSSLQRIIVMPSLQLMLRTRLTRSATVVKTSLL